MSLTVRKIRKFVLTHLGYNAVNIELTEADIDACIGRTLSLFNTYTPLVKQASVSASSGRKKYLIEKDGIASIIDVQFLDRSNTVGVEVLSNPFLLAQSAAFNSMDTNANEFALELAYQEDRDRVFGNDPQWHSDWEVVDSAITDTSGDTIPGEVAILFPAPNSTHLSGETVVVTGTSVPPAGVQIMDVRVNGVLSKTTNDWASWFISVPIVEGANTLTAVVRFTDSSQKSVSINVIRNLTTPLASISAIPEYTNNASLSIIGTTLHTDNITDIKVNGQSVVTSDAWVNWTFDMVLTLGPNIIDVVVEDSVLGTVQGPSKMLIYDTLAPTITVTSPASGATIYGSSVRVAGTSMSPLSPVSSISVRGVPAQTTDNWATWEAVVSGLSDGAHSLAVVAMNLGGNSSTISAPIVVDSVTDMAGPVVTVLAPANNGIVRNTVIKVSGVASDSTGVVSLSVNGIMATTTNNYATWEVFINVLNEGVNVINILAEDGAGNLTSKTTSVILDTQPLADIIDEVDQQWDLVDPAFSFEKRLFLYIDTPMNRFFQVSYIYTIALTPDDTRETGLIHIPVEFEELILRTVLGYAKFMLSHIRDKFKGIPGPDGSPLEMDGSDINSEALQELDECRMEFKSRSLQVPPLYG